MKIQLRRNFEFDICNFFLKMKIILLMTIIAIDSVFVLVYCSPPDPAKKIKNIVEDNGYSFEEHFATTEDGYILTIYRVFKSRNISQIEKPVALCVHGIMGSSVDWVLTGPKISIAFLLADSGYDVWLFNARGVTNSKKHVTYLETSYQFWNFSGHEIGFYDLPATVDYVLKNTGHSDLFYVGFSQGGGILFIMGSLRPEYNKKIRMAALLAPAVYLGGLGGVTNFVFQFTYPLSALLEKIGHFEILSASSLWRVLTNLLCNEHAITQRLCFNALYSLTGDGTDQEDPSSLTKIFTYFPAGLSTKQFFYFGFSNINADHFRQYDYGKVKNMKVYNSPEPPEYPIYKTDIPIAIFEGLNDLIIKSQDIDLLVKNVPNVIYREMITKKKLSHLDFIYGRDIRELAYLKILDLFETYRKNEKLSRS